MVRLNFWKFPQISLTFLTNFLKNFRISDQKLFMVITPTRPTSQGFVYSGKFKINFSLINSFINFISLLIFFVVKIFFSKFFIRIHTYTRQFHFLNKNFLRLPRNQKTRATVAKQQVADENRCFVVNYRRDLSQDVSDFM